MTDAPPPSPSSPAQIRKRGLVNAGIGLGGIALGRVLVEIMIATGSSSPIVSGALAVLFPVIAAFGITAAITGSERGWYRIPIVVVLSILLIGFAFYVLIPSGYRMSRS